MQKLLLILGLIISLIGVFFPYLKQLGLGQLPGDLIFKAGNSTFYFPVVSCIVISLILSLMFNLFRSTQN